MSRGLEHSDGSEDATLPGEAWDEDEDADHGGLARGTSVGRYLVLARLGAGAMGVVHAAYDPELDRKVALKLLRGGRDDARGRARLLREAQALARLSHPNVVAVYDVGTHEDEVWIAMEFVAGQTLGAWLRQRRRSWREILALMVQAGRGLVAAHTKGLVHRDFKPDNVMIGEDGRARVMDFGLARTPLSEDPEHSGPLIEPSIEALIEGTMLSPDSVDLTAAGALMGTPRYMAPEQYAGNQADARSDQFSFCVTLWESIYHERAFAGGSLAALSTSVTQGELRQPPPGSRVPTWLRRVIERGLRVEPGQRWSGMADLLTALEPKRSQRHYWVIALGGLLGLVGGVYGVQQLQRAHRVDACKVEAQALREQTWTEEARTEVGEALAATGLAYAEDVRARVFERVGAYVDEWASVRMQLCYEATIDEQITAEAHELGVECLDEGRHALDELLVVFGAEVDRELLTRAVSSVASLPRLARCRDQAWLARRVRPPQDPETREAVAKLRARIERVDVLRGVSRFDEALVETEAILAEAESLEWRPLIAEVRFMRGVLLGSVGRHEEAVIVLEQALHGATSSGHDEIAAAAAEALVFRLGSSLARPEEGMRYAALAEAFIMRAGLEGQVLDARLRTHVGAVRHRQGDYEAALESYGRAQAIFEQTLGADHPELARVHANIGVVHYTQGAYDDALAAYARGEALQQQVFGARHPGLARTWSNIGVVHFVEGRHEEALGYYVRALELMEATLGPDHIDLATLINNVGMTHYQRGEDEAAQAHYERALAIREGTLGPDHPDVANALNNLALVRGSLGAAPEEVAQLLERALTILEAKLGPEHPQVAGTLTNVGINLVERGLLDEARATHERARDIVAASLGPAHPHMAHSLANLGEVALAAGDSARALELYDEARGIYAKAYDDPAHPELAEALRGLGLAYELEGRFGESTEQLERALAIRERGGARPRELADIRFPLARVLWAAGETRRDEARELAGRARDDYASDHRPGEQAKVESWLETHPLGGEG